MTNRELATILHALRILQEIRRTETDGCRDHELNLMMPRITRSSSCDHFTEVAALTNEEIEALCESLNLAPAHGPDNPCADRGCAICNPADSEDDAKYREAGKCKWVANHEGIDIDAGALVSGSNHAGAYVQGWLWVSNSEAGIASEEEKVTNANQG